MKVMSGQRPRVRARKPVYRNYFAPVDGRDGQTAERQLDGLADLSEALRKALNKPVEILWSMRNDYALCSRAGLDARNAFSVFFPYVAPIAHYTIEISSIST
jgi:hypothetical protein